MRSGAFTITASYRERHGYPPFAGRARRKIFGLDAATLDRVDPVKVHRDSSREELAEIRRTFPDGNHTLGPSTIAQYRTFHRQHRGWP